VKKQFSDKGAEALAFLHGKGEFTVEDVHEYIRSQVQECRSEKVDASTAGMDMFNKMPRWMGKAIVRFLMFLDRHGWVPADLIATDPYYSSVVISNLGSIKLKCGYHHLTNWGTCSLFCIIGEKKRSPFLDENGSRVGTHQGAVRYTIGQRKGLGLAMGAPVYVCAKDMQANTVTVGPEDALFDRIVYADEVNWISVPGLTEPLRVTARTRYHQVEQPATVFPAEGGFRLEFDQPQRAPTPGQAVVLYQGDVVLGGGTITSVER